jgi:hypothetical protein
MFDKFGIVTPIKKNNYNVEEEVLKYFNALINATNFNHILLRSQLYNYDKSLDDCFKKILEEHNDYFQNILESDLSKSNAIIDFIDYLPERFKIRFEEFLLEDLNGDKNYDILYEKIMDNENIVIHENIKKYFLVGKFDEYYCKRLTEKLKTFSKAKQLKSEYNYIETKIINYYQLGLHLNCSYIILKIIPIICDFIVSINNEKLKIKTLYDYSRVLNTFYHKFNSLDRVLLLQYIETYNNIINMRNDLLNKYITNCFNNYDDKKFEELNKIIYYCKYKTDIKILEDNKSYYFKYIFQNTSKKNIYKFIANMLILLNGNTEEILILFEKKIKNALLNVKHDKFYTIINEYKNILSKIGLEPNTYDFIKQMENLISIYDIKNKEKDFRKLLTLQSDTFINKYDIDDIYMNELSELNKVINQISKDSLYISKEQSLFIIEIIKDDKIENVKLNMNQYMILLSLENNIENNLDVLKKGYGSKNIDYLIKQRYIEINNNIAKKLIN